MNDIYNTKLAFCLIKSAMSNEMVGLLAGGGLGAGAGALIAKHNNKSMMTGGLLGALGGGALGAGVGHLSPGSDESANRDRTDKEKLMWEAVKAHQENTGRPITMEDIKNIYSTIAQ